jgi:beta-lactam-binding protein with PASTA domain
LRRLLKYVLLGLVLLLIFLSSALLSMRLAIHGREVRVPNVAGLTPVQAERIANSEGLALSVGSRYYSASVARGRVISQYPAPQSTVRRGWKILVAESLGPRSADVPDLTGQSPHAAGINLGRRGLEIGSVATIHLPGAAPQTVVAQSPRPDANDVTSSQVNLVLSAPDNTQDYVMPSFLGQTLAQAKKALVKSGFSLAKKQITSALGKDGKEAGEARAVIVKQLPRPGEKVAAGATVYFEISNGTATKDATAHGGLIE